MVACTTTGTHGTCIRNYTGSPRESIKTRRILTRYNYRITLEEVPLEDLSEISNWCSDNCLRNYEIHQLPQGGWKYNLVCAFEKKTDAVGFKLRWIQ